MKEESLKLTIAKGRQALRILSARLPPLAGLAAIVEVHASDDVRTAEVTCDGRITLNPEFFLALNRDDEIFVVAHELMHLALLSHDRGRKLTEPWNQATDYVINDILRHELGNIPVDGRDWQGASFHSAEHWFLKLQRQQERSGVGTRSVKPLLAGDLSDRDRKKPALSTIHARSAALGKSREQAIKGSLGPSAVSLGGELGGLGGENPRATTTELSSDRNIANENWIGVLHQWVGSAFHATPSYSRASRRNHTAQTDIVQPGWKRKQHVLHLVLANNVFLKPTITEFLGALGGIAEECEVEMIHSLQCHMTDSTECWTSPGDLLARFNIHLCGCYGVVGPMRKLEEAGVASAIIFHAGGVTIPETPPDYQVLWAYAGPPGEFRPKYGVVVQMEA